METEISLGHESLSSPLFRFSETGALLRLPGLRTLSGSYVRIGTGGMLALPADGGQWTLAGRADWKRAPAARDLDFGNLSGDLTWRQAFAGGQAGIGLGRQHLSVAGSRFRVADGIQADWTRPTAGEGHWALLSALSRQRHPQDPDLDGTVASLSAQRHQPQPVPGLDALDLELAAARERNRHGYGDLSSRNLFLRLSVDRHWAGIEWSAGVAMHRASFDAALQPSLPVRRDRAAMLEFSASRDLGDGTSLRVEFQEARNRSNVALYENRYRNASVTLVRRW